MAGSVGRSCAGTTSGASAEFMVIVRMWPSGLAVTGEVGVVGCAPVDPKEESELLGVTSLVEDSVPFLIEGVTTCFSTSEAALGSARARICGSDDRGSDNGNDLGRNFRREDSEDFPRLCVGLLLYCSGIGGTSGTVMSERRWRESLVKTVDERDIG